MHGHNYDLEVTVTGPINEETGFVADLGLLKKIVNEKVINIIDHSTIEKDLDGTFIDLDRGFADDLDELIVLFNESPESLQEAKEFGLPDKWMNSEEMGPLN